MELLLVHMPASLLPRLRGCLPDQEHQIVLPACLGSGCCHPTHCRAVCQTANMPVTCAGSSQLLAGLGALDLRLRVHGLTVTHSNMFPCLLVLRRAELLKLTRQPCRTKACRVCHTVCKQRPKAVNNAHHVDDDKLCAFKCNAVLPCVFARTLC